MLLAIVNVAKFAQNCQNLPKFTQRQLVWGTLKCHQNWDFSVFQKWKFLCVEEAVEYVFTVWIFNTIIFLCPFYCQKTAFVCEF
jgi:hypothetical protein